MTALLDSTHHPVPAYWQPGATTSNQEGRRRVLELAWASATLIFRRGNIMDSLVPLQIYMLKSLTPDVMVLGGEAFGRYFSHEWD